MAEIPDYPGNANFARPVSTTPSTPTLPTKIQPVVTKPIKQIKKRPSFIESLFDTRSKSIGNYFLEDLLYPNLRRAMSSVLHGMVSKIFGGGTDPTSPWGSPYVYSNTWGNGDRYNDYTAMSVTQARTSQKPQKPNLMQMNSFIFPDRGECEKVLSVLDELVDSFGWAPVSAFYEAIGITADHTFNNYGWTNIASAKVRQVAGGFVIDLPRPRPVD